MAAELPLFGASTIAAIGGRPIIASGAKFSFVLFPARKQTSPLCAASKTASETKQAKRPPRGITKARPVSPAMQELLGVSEIPRTQAVKKIWDYIKQHGLQVS